MATGESEEWYKNLDVEGLITEIENVETSGEAESKDCSLSWEVTKADKEYEDIAKNPFLGFDQQTSTPIKSAHSYSVRRKARKGLKGTRSAPVSPASPSPKVQETIKSWEKLSNPDTGAISKIKTSQNPKVKTRAAIEKGLASPLKPPGDFLRRRKINLRKKVH